MRTYKDLYRAMLLWARYLDDRFGADRSPVVIYGRKQNDIIGCMLGCGFTRRPYAPMDSSAPADRVRAVIRELQPALTVDFTGGLPDLACAVLRPCEIPCILNGTIDEETDFKSPAADSDILYILFTSGSTGKPKGVQITHKNLQAYLNGIAPYFYTGGGPLTVLNSFAYSFDLSAGYIYPSLRYGYTLYSIDKDVFGNFSALFAELRASNIKIAMATPSLMAICAASAKFGREVLPLIEKFIFCGETLPNELARVLKTRFGGAEIINAYGPTETTIAVTGALITDEMINENRPLPIGRPLEGAKLRVVNKNGDKISGGHGEIQILGDFVGAGYYKNPAMTERAFFTDETTGERGYRTGDIGYTENGFFYYCHRNDLQIKLYGYRIEPGDIENNFLKIGRVYMAAVIPAAVLGDIRYLAAFVVLSERVEKSDALEAASLKKELAGIVPDYMVPQRIIIKDRLPMNPSGKIDRKALAAEIEQ